MRQKFQRSPYSYLLADNTFSQWIENAERGSAVAAANHLKQMGKICKEIFRENSGIRIQIY